MARKNEPHLRLVRTSANDASKRDHRTPPAIAEEEKQACAGAELADFPFVIANAIKALSPMATVNGVLNLVYEETEELLDVAQTYQALNILIHHQWVREMGPVMERGRSMRSFAISKSGMEVINAKAKHMERLLALKQRTTSMRKPPVKLAKVQANNPN